MGEGDQDFNDKNMDSSMNIAIGVGDWGASYGITGFSEIYSQRMPAVSTDLDLYFCVMDSNIGSTTSI